MSERAACGVTFPHDWHGYLGIDGRMRVCDGEPTQPRPNPSAEEASER